MDGGALPGGPSTRRSSRQSGPHHFRLVWTLGALAIDPLIAAQPCLHLSCRCFSERRAGPQTQNAYTGNSLLLGKIAVKYYPRTEQVPGDRPGLCVRASLGEGEPPLPFTGHVAGPANVLRVYWSAAECRLFDTAAFGRDSRRRSRHINHPISAALRRANCAVIDTEPPTAAVGRACVRGKSPVSAWWREEPRPAS